MTEFQANFLRALDTGVWYDVHRNQSTGGAALPGWFYEQQSEPMNTIKPLIVSKAVDLREVGIHKLPQIKRRR